MAYVYRHIRLDKNEPFYIGIGSDERYKRANEKARRSTIWKNIVAKTDYHIEILFDELTWDEAKSKEIEFIKLYGRKNLDNGTLANMTDGGDGMINIVFTLEHRRKISEGLKKRVIPDSMREKLRKYKLGIPNSPEVRKKISEANKGRKLSIDNILKLKQRTGDKNPMFGKTKNKCPNYKGLIEAYKDGILIGVFEGLSDCSSNLNITNTKISACLNGRRNHTGGYTFKRILNKNTI